MATVALESMLLGLPALGDGGLESHEWHRTTLYTTSLVNILVNISQRDWIFGLKPKQIQVLQGVHFRQRGHLTRPKVAKYADMLGATANDPLPGAHVVNI